MLALASINISFISFVSRCDMFKLAVDILSSSPTISLDLEGLVLLCSYRDKLVVSNQ